MITRFSLGAAAALLFAVVATANSGGYRYGISDQAFYVPALARTLDASLFPRDQALLATQMRFWLGDDVVAAASRVLPVDLPALAGALYVVGLVTLAGAIAFFLRGLGASWWAVSAGLALAALRHRIPRTGANSLEGYFHPRMIAVALGLWALGFVLRRRFGPALLVVALAGVVHPTTAMWMGAAVIVAAAWHRDRRMIWVVAIAMAAVTTWLLVAGLRMDAAWLAVVAEKDYLFPTAWPAWAWAINLAYPVVLWTVYQRRVTLDKAVPGERALVVGLLVLMAGFLVSIPLTASNIAIVVELQVTRVLWVLDGVTLLYLAWWFLDDVALMSGARWRTAALVLLIAAAAGRGYYVLVVDAGRPLVTWNLRADDWNDAMRFLRAQPARLHVLADPGHAWKYGTSVRVAALRDTVIEQVKDSAMAIYDRDVALRVADRTEALSGFEDFSELQCQAAGSRYHADVLVVERDRRFTLPVLYENGRFVVYDLR